ncbi:MAG: hypothetical protein U0270_30460 [Labilithrix sp.]
MSTRTKRLLQLFFTGVFGLFGLALLVTALVAGHGGAGAAGAAVVPLVMAGIFYGIFEVQIRSFARAGLAVKSSIEACAKTVFDEPSTIAEGYDLDATTTNQLMAGFAREANNDAAFTTQGRRGDVKISVASHVSMMGRQIGEFHHTYSHVLVDMLGLNKTFRVTRERVSSKLGKALGATNDVKTGDQAFDDLFVIDTDEKLARAVFDDSIKKRLTSLQGQVASVSTDMGVGGMGIVMTNRGLALRWPGEITPELAAFIRDLLIDMREKILAHENRVAVRIGTEATASGGYRVPEDATEAIAEAEVEAQRNAAG